MANHEVVASLDGAGMALPGTEAALDGTWSSGGGDANEKEKTKHCSERVLHKVASCEVASGAGERELSWGLQTRLEPLAPST